MKFTTKFLLLSLAILLTACSSQSRQMQFYQLNSVENLETQPLFRITDNIELSVSNIKFPDYLDRPQVLLRSDDYTLQLNDQHRWISPLKDDFSRVLLINLNTHLAPSSVVSASDPTSKKSKIQLHIEVLNLDVNSQNQTLLNVKWRYNSRTDKEKVYRGQKKYQLQFSNPSYPARVEALSQTIALFSEQLASSIRNSYPHIFSENIRK